jgi:sarcosine oxidase subunit beta
MAETGEIIVIGGGVVGLSIAYHLTRLGCRDVIVLDRESIGSGSTSKCPGGIRQQFATETNIRLSMEGVKFFERLRKKPATQLISVRTDISCRWRIPGRSMSFTRQ